MSSFIFGDHGAHKLCTFLSAYVGGRVRKAKTNLDVKCYHPILSNPSIYNSISTDDILFLLNESKKITFKKEVLEAKEKIYSEIDYIKALNATNSRYRLFPNIAEYFTGIESELICALKLIDEYGGWISKLFSELIFEICPIRLKSEVKRFKGGFSDYNLIGSIFISPMPKEFGDLELSISLVHELGHQALFLLQAGENPIHKSDAEKEIYSSVRKVNRPVLGSIHALVAASYMADFICSLLEKRDNTIEEVLYLQGQLDLHISQLQIGLEATKVVKFTMLGNKLIRDLSDELNLLERTRAKVFQ